MSIPVGGPHAALVWRSISNARFIAASTKSGFFRKPCSVISGFSFAHWSARLGCEIAVEAGLFELPAAGHDLSRSPGRQLILTTARAGA